MSKTNKITITARINPETRENLIRLLYQLFNKDPRKAMTQSQIICKYIEEGMERDRKRLELDEKGPLEDLI